MSRISGEELERWAWTTGERGEVEVERNVEAGRGSSCSKIKLDH